MKGRLRMTELKAYEIRIDKIDSCTSTVVFAETSAMAKGKLYRELADIYPIDFSWFTRCVRRRDLDKKGR